MKKNTRIELLIIDPQNDFCDPKGALYVQGAEQDAERLASLIRRIGDKIYDIHVTLDTHHYVCISHPIFWKNSAGDHPKPFTMITAEDVRKGTWTTTNPAFFQRAKAYVEELEKNARYALIIWNPHCLIGTWGHNVIPVIGDALLEWEKGFSMVDYVTKGSNFWTEHYSAVQADVPDPDDPSTLLNTPLIKTLERADIIPISGQASSHCVAWTVTDIANNFGEESIKKMVLLKDTSSPVPGFEHLERDFIADLTSRGMKISNSVDFLR